MRSKTTALASAAALLFAAGAAHAESHGMETEGQGEEIKCEGVNACKGHSACQTASSGCAGQNACKGKGFLMMTPEECERAKAEKAEKAGKKKEG